MIGYTFKLCAILLFAVGCTRLFKGLVTSPPFGLRIKWKWLSRLVDIFFFGSVLSAVLLAFKWEPIYSAIIAVTAIFTMRVAYNMVDHDNEASGLVRWGAFSLMTFALSFVVALIFTYGIRWVDLPY